MTLSYADTVLEPPPVEPAVPEGVVFHAWYRSMWICPVRCGRMLVQRSSRAPLPARVQGRDGLEDVRLVIEAPDGVDLRETFVWLRQLGFRNVVALDNQRSEAS